jgi:phage tail-like protein
MAVSLTGKEVTPLTAYRFSVLIAVDDIPMLTDLRFQSAGPLKLKRKVEWDHNTPALVNDDPSETITLTRGAVSALSGNLSMLNLANFKQVNKWDDRMSRCTLLVAALNSRGLPTTAWKVENAVLTELAWGDMDAEKNAVLIESMTFAYSHMRPFVL